MIQTMSSHLYQFLMYFLKKYILSRRYSFYNNIYKPNEKLWGGMVLAVPTSDMLCAGHGTRLKGEPTISNYGSQGKSQAQPDGGEGCSGITTGYR